MKIEQVQTNRGTFVRLTADPGKRITDKLQSFFAETVCLGVNDRPENYQEVAAGGTANERSRQMEPSGEVGQPAETELS